MEEWERTGRAKRVSHIHGLSSKVPERQATPAGPEPSGKWCREFGDSSKFLKSNGYPQQMLSNRQATSSQSIIGDPFQLKSVDSWEYINSSSLNNRIGHGGTGKLGNLILMVVNKTTMEVYQLHA